jgi:hypothetical protein
MPFELRPFRVKPRLRPNNTHFRQGRLEERNTTWKVRVKPIDILYTLDSASNYSAIQKLKP